MKDKVTPEELKQYLDLEVPELMRKTNDKKLSDILPAASNRVNSIGEVERTR